MIRSIVYRVLLSLLLGAGIAFFIDVSVSNISDTLFTVLGIVYSIVMSLLITFSTSKIKNPVYRKEIKQIINEKIRITTIDFFVPILFYLSSHIIESSFYWVKSEHCLVGAIIIALVSLNRVFFYIRKLNDDIEESVFQEQDSTP